MLQSVCADNDNCGEGTHYQSLQTEDGVSLDACSQSGLVLLSELYNKGNVTTPWLSRLWMLEFDTPIDKAMIRKAIGGVLTV